MGTTTSNARPNHEGHCAEWGSLWRKGTVRRAGMAGKHLGHRARHIRRPRRAGPQDGTIWCIGAWRGRRRRGGRRRRRRRPGRAIRIGRCRRRRGALARRLPDALAAVVAVLVRACAGRAACRAAADAASPDHPIAVRRGLKRGALLVVGRNRARSRDARTAALVVGRRRGRRLLRHGRRRRRRVLFLGGERRRRRRDVRIGRCRRHWARAACLRAKLRHGGIVAILKRLRAWISVQATRRWRSGRGGRGNPQVPAIETLRAPASKSAAGP